MILIMRFFGKEAGSVFFSNHFEMLRKNKTFVTNFFKLNWSSKPEFKKKSQISENRENNTQ